MSTILIILGSNLFALMLAVLLKMNITEMYAILAFNFVLFLFIGVVNLAGLVQLLLKSKELENDTTTTFIDPK